MTDRIDPDSRVADAQRETAEADLFASEERFHRLVDAITDYAIFMLDPTGRVATWNAGARRTKGYDASEIVGKHFSIFYTPEDRAAGRPGRILETLRREGRFEEEGWRVRKDGSRFWASVVITALRNQEGEISGFAKITRDLSERRGVEEQLHASEERFHRLVDAITDYAILMLDVTGHVATWNAGARKTKGYEADEVVGKHFSAFYTPEDRAAGRPERILEAVRREGRFEEEGWRVRKDGSRFWANVVLTALRDQRGEIAGFAKITRDLTERRSAEENERKLVREQIARTASEAAQQEMERVNRAKDEFLATMSHELRTPLNAITGWVTILRNKPRDPDKLDRGLEVIDRNARAQTRIISDLLDVSRIISGKLQLSPISTEVVPLIMAAADVVRPAADGKGVRLVVDVDPHIGAVVADPDRMQQIIWNLLTNAVRFTARGGRVTVSGDRADAGVVIGVHDTGAGIAPEHLPRLFERFMQVDGSITRAHGGLGLGLAIVRHLVEAHGGSVRAESGGLGRGASFTVTLPIRAVSTMPEAGPEAEALPEPTSEPLARLDGVHVLVVDDDKDSLEVVREVLERGGAKVTTADSARAGLQAIDADGSIAVVVSDIGMPETDGYSFMRSLRARNGGVAIPAIALTAYARGSDAELARRAGYQEHLVKPIDERTLLRAVKTWSTQTNSAPKGME